jgi:hypothetical protein
MFDNITVNCYNRDERCKLVDRDHIPLSKSSNNRMRRKKGKKTLLYLQLYVFIWKNVFSRNFSSHWFRCPYPDQIIGKE